MTADRDTDELLRSAHRATHEALANYAAGFQGMSADTVARLLIGAAASVVAAGLGPVYAADLLRSLADNLSSGRDPQELN